MYTKNIEVNELFEKWILDSETKVDEQSLLKDMKQYLLSQHSEICGKCTPCRDGVARLEVLIDNFLSDQATRQNVIEMEQITNNLRSSRCSVGLDIGKNFEVILKNYYHVFFKSMK